MLLSISVSLLYKFKQKSFSAFSSEECTRRNAIMTLNYNSIQKIPTWEKGRILHVIWTEKKCEEIQKI